MPNMCQAIFIHLGYASEWKKNQQNSLPCGAYILEGRSLLTYIFLELQNDKDPTESFSLADWHTPHSIIKIYFTYQNGYFYNTKKNVKCTTKL